MVTDNKKEVRLIRSSIAVTAVIFLLLYASLIKQGVVDYKIHDTASLIGIALFGFAMLFVAYGNFLYQICLMGNYKRLQKHSPASREMLEMMYEKPAPALSIIIPSYKEERSVIWQTMMSSALAEYPSKNVVLLIDDPIPAKVLEDIVKLDKTRAIIGELQVMFDKPKSRFAAEQQMFADRRQAGRIFSGLELGRISSLYEEVADWLEASANEFSQGKTPEQLHHSERFFVKAIMLAPAKQHRELAAEMRSKMAVDERVSDDYLARHYARLTALFTVNFSSFERKKYVNLSHEANKAMNLNCYISLIGKSWKEVDGGNGLELHECTAGEEGAFTIPAADYVDTIDADSLMLSDYALRLVHLMEMPGNHRLAVVQSPCSAYPECPDLLERIAGACIDVQFRTHQGYTYWDATFWVGANAMLRKKALEEIKETHTIDGKTVNIYIQDRTVIEDTESTIDLVEKGWKLYNYPERMTFSSTPPDFGSLLIQRRRWSNGGLIILPKLLAYTRRATKNLALLKEFYMRFNYLASTTTGVIVAIFLMAYPFGEIEHAALLPLSVLPLLLLYSRDLKNTGYKYSDTWRVCAFNLMVFPIAIGGVCKQFQQMITGKKIPFGRTPKITGRTAAPALYCIIELLMTLAFVVVSVRNVEKGEWLKASFSGINAVFMVYALLHYIGIKPLFEDIGAVFITRWRNTFHHAEIIPMPLRWLPSSLNKRNRAS